jgi:peroxiredoxin
VPLGYQTLSPIAMSGSSLVMNSIKAFALTGRGNVSFNRGVDFTWLVDSLGIGTKAARYVAVVSARSAKGWTPTE